MSRKARSSRGVVVDFDLLAIKQQLATAPVPVSVTQRRQFIDAKDGIRTRTVQPLPEETPGALAMAIQGAEKSAAAVDDVEAPAETVVEEVAVEEAPKSKK